MVSPGYGMDLISSTSLCLIQYKQAEQPGTVNGQGPLHRYVRCGRQNFSHAKIIQESIQSPARYTYAYIHRQAYVNLSHHAIVHTPYQVRGARDGGSMRGSQSPCILPRQY